MKKLLALVLVVLVLVSGPIALAIQVPRQVDPSTAPSDPVYGQGLYLFYGAIVGAVTGGNFTAASALIKQTGFIHIPAEIADAVNSFNRLVNSTANLFLTVDHQLKNASGYVSTGRLALARISLQGAIINLRSANITLTQLFGAEPQLAAITGIPSSLLLQKLQPLETLFDSDTAQANRLLKVITGASRLNQATLTLSVTPATIETGSSVVVGGQLTRSSGSPLPARNVTVYFENSPIGSATTSNSGRFSTSFKTPYYYQKVATMFASFLPAGNDTLVYAPSTSAPVKLNVTYSLPDASVSIPKSVLAGQRLHTFGTVSKDGRPLSNLQISLSGFKLTSTNFTLRNGSFAIDLEVPSSLGQGTYPLTFATGSNGTLGPLVSLQNVIVIKIDPTIKSNIPIVAFAGFPTTISGSVRANGSSLAGARVLNVSPSPSVSVATTGDGTFSFSVTPPLTISNGGWSYTLEVFPTQSWISATPLNVSVFVVNPLVLALPVASLAILAFSVRRRRPPGQISAPELFEEQGPAEVIQAAPLPTGLAGIYSRAVEIVERATSIPLKPQTTIREYLAAVRGVLKGIKHFEYISSALESQLYGPGVAAEVEGWAETELRELRKELEA